MNLPAPSAMAIRAVREYRRRDIVPYLALRYYLVNRSARRDRWATEVAVPLALQSTASCYLAVKHFKEREHDRIGYRDLYLPGANEALAEAVLLAECSKHSNFDNPSTVFSYDLAKLDETDGMFRSYFRGLQRRHEEIAKACRRYARPIVRYGDVRKFYPSIAPDLAKQAWAAASARAPLPTTMTDLGHRLIASHLHFNAGDRPKLLTGPMFSHLLGNLVLRGLDAAMSAKSDVSYFRYVDDIVLVGSRSAVNEAYKEVTQRLDAIGLHLHAEGSGKHLVVESAEWLRGEHDFRDTNEPIHWRSLVGRLKWLLTSAPGQHNEIRSALRNAGFRLPVPDYGGAVRERSYLRRLKRLVQRVWFRQKVMTLGQLVEHARALRKQYIQETQSLVSTIHGLEGYARRRVVPKLRHRAGRLAYLADERELTTLASQLKSVPELEFHADVLMGIATGDVTEVLLLGANAAQAVAQPLHAEGRGARVRRLPRSDIAAQGMAVLALNGVAVTGEVEGDWHQSEFVRIARDGVTPDLMRSKDPFIRELASLHGLSDRPRHPDMLDSAFDPAEELVFDAVGQMVFSAST